MRGRRDNVTQIILQGTIKPTRAGTDMIVFTLPLGPLGEVVCLVNIPGPDEQHAPVYAKFNALGEPAPQRANPREYVE